MTVSAEAISQIAGSVSLDPEILARELRKMHPGMVLTGGTHISVVNGYVRDLEWNAFDFWHRIFVHHTYNDALQVFSGKHFSVNVTRWGKLPIFIQVANAWIKPGVFLQTMSVLGIIYCHQIVRLTQQDKQVHIEVTWHTGSHWLFRWLHPFFNARLMKLQKIQDAEDKTIRDQRFALRERGFKFTTDVPDFLNSNELTDNVIVPETNASFRFPVQNLPSDKPERIQAGPLPFLVRRETSGVTVWPAMCPHEGAGLGDEHLCDNRVQCPWHGRKFRGTLLESDSQWEFLTARLRLEDGDLVVAY